MLIKLKNKSYIQFEEREIGGKFSSLPICYQTVEEREIGGKFSSLPICYS